MNICFQHFTHAWTTILPWILWSDVRIKFKMADLLPFCLHKLTKYLKILSVRMHISNTNEYCFPILYTCINYNPPMNPVKFPQDQIKNGWLNAIFVCSNWQNTWKFCPSGWISPTPMNICFRYFTHALTTILPCILITTNKVFYPVGDTIALAIYLLYICLAMPYFRGMFRHNKIWSPSVKLCFKTYPGLLQSQHCTEVIQSKLM